MANYKVVDADQLDADLTFVADSIRTKGGTSDQMVFPDGFRSAVENIPDYMDQWATGILTEFYHPTASVPRESGFTDQKMLRKVELPNAWNSGYYAFCRCSALETVIMPKLEKLETASFISCTSLKRIDFPLLKQINPQGFQNSGVETLIIRKTDGLCTMSNANALGNTPIAKGTGYIYVPRALVDSYKSATNWSTYASQIRAIEDYPEVLEGWE